MPIEYTHDHENEITLFAETNFRNQKRRFGIKTDDRRRHMYVIGKTGMGKTTLLENLIVSDINAGHGCCYIDPHGDTAEGLIDFIPANRINDVVYFNPADTDFPMGFNILETENDAQKPLVASGLMGVFKKIWPDVWSARMEYIMMNCVLALLDYPGSTLLGINRLLVDKEYRARVIAKIRDPIVKTFWVAEFSSWSEKYATEAIAPVQNKVGQFLSSSVIRNIVAQVKSTVNPRRIMDDGKILIANLSKGRIGEDNMRLLGGMLITKIQMAAQERQNIPNIADRRDFYLFVDEFQNFANESFANILSEARKYRLALIVAHQYIEQLDEKVRAAIFGNVGTIVAMRVGAADATFMETEFMPTFTPEDLVNLGKAQIYLKLSVDGVSTAPFSASTLPPIARRMESAEKVVAVSRERYAEPRGSIEDKVLKWSGMEAGPVGSGELMDTVLVNGAPANTDAALSAPPANLQYPTIQTEDEIASASTKSGIEALEGPLATEDTKEYLTIKPERLAAIAANKPQQQGPQKKKPQFPHTCSRCGKTFHLAIQLDPTRPMYCAECKPIVMEERKNRGEAVKKVFQTAPTPEGLPPLGVSAGVNRPRIVRAEDEPMASKQEKTQTHDPLLEEILQAKGRAEKTATEKITKDSSPKPPAPPVRPPARPLDTQNKPKNDRPPRAPSPPAPPKPPSAVRSTATPPSPPPVPSSAPSATKKSEPQAVIPGQRVRFDV